MTKLEMPKIEIRQKDTIKKFQEVCTGITILLVYGLLWVLIGALGYHLYLWVY